MIYTFFLKLNNTPWNKTDERLLGCISKERAAIIARQKHDSSKRLSLYSALLTRYALSDILNVSLSALEFEKNENKKPRLKNHAQHIDFSFSHTDGAVLLAVCDNGCIGADIENYETRIPPFNIMKRFFSEDEDLYVNEGLHEQTLRFYECWTAKEAFLKKSGTGLNTNLCAVNTLSETLSRNIITWCEQNYICSVCADDHHTERLSLDMLNMVRLDEDTLQQRISYL